jgi:hypothetical protein
MADENGCKQIVGFIRVGFSHYTRSRRDDVWMKHICQLISLTAIVAASIIIGVAGAATGPVIEWESWIGAAGHESVHDIYESGDGGYLLAGNTTQVNGTGDAYLIKIDGNGTKVWEKTYGGAGTDVFMGVEPVQDGFVMVGTTEIVRDGAAQLLLVRVDRNGTKVFEANASGRGIARGFSVIGLSDGSSIAVGLSGTKVGAQTDLYLVKFDAKGTRVWEKYYGGQGEDRAFSIVEAADGGFVVAGAMTPDGMTMSDAYLLKIDRDGNRAWEKYYGAGDRHEIGFDVTRMADGGFLVVGRSYTGSSLWGIPETSQVYVLRTDKDGVKQWEQTFGGSGFDRAWDSEELPDGYMVFGSKTMADGTEDFLLVKLTKAGMVASEQTLTAGTGHDRGYAMQETPDGGWILAGSSESKGAGGRDIWVVKIAPEGTKPVGTSTANTTANVTVPATQLATMTAASGQTTHTTTVVPTATKSPVGLAVALVALAVAALFVVRRR